MFDKRRIPTRWLWMGISRRELHSQWLCVTAAVSHSRPAHVWLKLFITTKIDGVERRERTLGKRKRKWHGNDNTRLGGGVIISHNNLSRLPQLQLKRFNRTFQRKRRVLFQLSVCAENATEPDTRPCVRGQEEITERNLITNPARRTTKRKLTRQSGEVTESDKLVPVRPWAGHERSLRSLRSMTRAAGIPSSLLSQLGSVEGSKSPSCPTHDSFFFFFLRPPIGFNEWIWRCCVIVGMFKSIFFIFCCFFLRTLSQMFSKTSSLLKIWFTCCN